MPTDYGPWVRAQVDAAGRLGMARPGSVQAVFEVFYGPTIGRHGRALFDYVVDMETELAAAKAKAARLEFLNANIDLELSWEGQEEDSQWCVHRCNGGKAVVECIDGNFLVGRIGLQSCKWFRDGTYSRTGPTKYYLVAPWGEPAPDPIDAEMQAWLAKVETGLEGTTPGDWTVTFEDGYCDTQICADSDKRKRIANVHPQKHDEDANHIANTNPKRMAELIGWLKAKGVMK